MLTLAAPGPHVEAREARLEAGSFQVRSTRESKRRNCSAVAAASALRKTLSSDPGRPLGVLVGLHAYAIVSEFARGGFVRAATSLARPAVDRVGCAVFSASPSQSGLGPLRGAARPGRHRDDPR